MLTQINARWATDYVGSNFRQEYYYNSEVNASTDNRVGRGIISSLYYEFGLGEKTKVQSAHQYTGELLSEQLTHTYSYTYSNNGRVKEEYIDGKLYRIYEYDEYGNCVVLKDSKDYIVECEYDKYGNLVKYKYDNRIFEYDNEYNSDGKIVKMVERANGKVTRWWEYIYENSTKQNVTDELATPTDIATDEIVTSTNNETETSVEFYRELKDYSKYVDLGIYSGMDVRVNSASVTDKQIEDVIDGIIKENTTYEEIREGVVKKGDIISIHYIAWLDGDVLWDSNKYMYTIKNGYDESLDDENIALDIIDDMLIGCEISRTHSMGVSFPEDYKNSKLAGKDVNFSICVNYVYGEADIPEWLKTHPHSFNYRWKKNNAIYLAAEHLSLDSCLPGAGCFQFTPNHKLTKEGCSRSVWNLPNFFREIPITYNANAWKEDGFHSAAKGQEFVFEANDKAIEWIQTLFC
jgi:hypothetical protein